MKKLYYALLNHFGVIYLRYIPLRLYRDAQERWHSWKFWYSPPWRATQRCPFCGGSSVRSGGYGDTFPCEDCAGSGQYIKWPKPFLAKICEKLKEKS